MFVLEYERKQDIVKSVISCRASSVSSNSLSEYNTNNKEEGRHHSQIEDSESFLLPWITSEEMDKVIAIWRDDCEESFIDMEEGKKLIFF